jgi:hypothetical protein
MSESIKEKIKMSIHITDMYNNSTFKIDFEYPAYPVGVYQPDIDLMMSHVGKMVGKDKEVKK